MSNTDRLDVAAMRRASGLTQVRLAEGLGVSQSFLSSIERGLRPLPAGKLDRLLELCNVGDVDGYVLPGGAEPRSRAGVPHACRESTPGRLERLEARADALQEKVEALLLENLRLKELCFRNGIDYRSD